MKLSDRLLAGDEPDRELEEAIYQALGNCNHKRYECYRVQGDSGQTCLDCGKDLYGATYAPRFTASLDAALSLYPVKPDTMPTNPRKAAAEALEQRGL